MSSSDPIPLDGGEPTLAGGPAVASEAPGFKPYVPDRVNMPELTWSAVLLGVVLGIVFGASSLYLFLKVGMTVSASIPIAVLAITIFRAFSKVFGTRRATILENNIVQTTGSAGESIAFGVGAAMPAVMILGYDMDPMKVMLVSILGGILGILMMIPLRRAFIVKQHGTLPYPEGTACAKILVAGEQGGTNARTVFAGFGLAFLYQTLMEAFHLWSKEPSKLITGVTGYDKAVLASEASPTLLGVGYIIGTRTACVMVGGGILQALVLIPAIAYFGGYASTPVAPGLELISRMGPGEIFSSYVRYIGAGAVAAGGIISMLRALPMIAASVSGGLRDLRSRAGLGGVGRTSRDLPMTVVFLGSLALVAVISSTSLIPTDLAGRLVGAAMIVLFGFLFVTVSSRLTGEIGSSSNPISGMTIATLLMTCLIFYLIGWVGPEYRLTALSVAAIVCIASSNGGTTSQDLKTGYLVGATPKAQQYGILAGAITSAIVIGFTLLLLNKVYTDVTSDPQYLPTVAAPYQELSEEAPADLVPAAFAGQPLRIWRITKAAPGVLPGKYLVGADGTVVARVDPGIGGIVKQRADGTKATKFNPPQPALFAVIIDGIMTGELPWVLVILGAGLAIVVWLAGVSPLAFAVGVYLPLATTVPIFFGGLVRGIVDRARKVSAEESDSSPAVLMSSGLIAGGSMAGILIAGLAVLPLARSYYTTDALPAATATAPADRDAQATETGPDGQTYRVWKLEPPAEDEAADEATAPESAPPAASDEPGTYLVDDQGRAVYRAEVSTSLDLSRRFKLPRGWDERPLPAVIAFSTLMLILLWVGLRAKPITSVPLEADMDLSRRGEIELDDPRGD